MVWEGETTSKPCPFRPRDASFSVVSPEPYPRAALARLAYLGLSMTSLPHPRLLI